MNNFFYSTKEPTTKTRVTNVQYIIYTERGTVWYSFIEKLSFQTLEILLQSKEKIINHLIVLYSDNFLNKDIWEQLPILVVFNVKNDLLMMDGSKLYL